MKIFAFVSCIYLAANLFALPEESEVVRVNDADLHYVKRGQGEPVVFVHGTLGDFHTWDTQLDEFAKSFQVISYSRRYHPPNEKPTDDAEYSVERHAADLGGLIQSLKLGRVHLVGSSYGAYIALMFAIKHPDLVRSLVLGEPPILPWLSNTSVGDSIRKSFTANALIPARDAFKQGQGEEGLRKFIDGLTGQPGTFDRMPAETRQDILTKADEMKAELLTDESKYLPALSCEQQVRKLKMPILLLSGERSVTLFHLITLELERCLDGEKHVMIPSAGHSMHANSKSYNETVIQFLSKR